MPGGISSVPDGMACAVLIGVNPAYGIYASIAGPIAGGLTSSTRLMVVTTTSAAALAAGSALSGVAPQSRAGALFLLTVLAGLIMIGFGLLRAGRYTRFVSHSVMTGFLTGVAVNIVLGQLPALAGADAFGAVNLTRAINLLLHPSRVDPASLLAGGAAIALMIGLGRTRAAPISSLAALALPTAAVIAFGATSVARLRDSGDIPSGLPTPALPDLGALSPGVLLGALSVAAIVLVQGAGGAQAAPNADGLSSDPNRDFLAQGVANLAAGLLRGQPVGGSVSGTALNVSAGARTRWAGVLSGVWVLTILLAFSELIGSVARPTLAAVLIVAGIGSVRLGEVIAILRTGPTSVIAWVTTFIATLLLPIAAAVGVGVALSLLLQLNRDAMDLRVVELLPHPDGSLREAPPPTTLRTGKVTLLDVYGSLLYAGSRTLQARLPQPAASGRAVTVLRLRGRTALGATFFQVIQEYAKQLETVGQRLFLSGVDPAVEQHLRSLAERNDGLFTVISATPTITESSVDALIAGRRWLSETRISTVAAQPPTRRRMPSREARKTHPFRATPLQGSPAILIESKSLIDADMQRRGETA